MGGRNQDLRIYVPGKIVRHQALRWIGVIQDQDRPKLSGHDTVLVLRVLDRSRKPIAKKDRVSLHVDASLLAVYIPRSEAQQRLIEVWSRPQARWSDLPEQYQTKRGRAYAAAKGAPNG
jgi:hypothetical protein